MLLHPETISKILDMAEADADQLLAFLSSDDEDGGGDYHEHDHHLLKNALLDSSSSFHSTVPTTQHKNKHIQTEPKVQDSFAYLVSEPSVHCVVFGRDKFAHKHPGNIFFRQLVSELREDYQSTKVRKKKASITRQIINAILSKGGRFLKKSSLENTEGWYQVDDVQVYEKVSHALRSAKPGCGKSSSMTMKNASSFSNSPAITMPVETPVQEGSFHDLMRRQSQILSSLKSGSAAYAPTPPQQSTNDMQVPQSTIHTMPVQQQQQQQQQQHHPPYPPYMPYHPSDYPYNN